MLAPPGGLEPYFGEILDPPLEFNTVVPKETTGELCKVILVITFAFD